MSKRTICLWSLLVVGVLLVVGCAGPATPTATPEFPTTPSPPTPTTPPPATPTPEKFLFGIVLVGPKNDHGWSEAHYIAAEYVKEHVPGSDFIVYESLIPGGEVTLEQVVDDMVAQGAKLILTTSAAVEEDTIGVA